MAKLDCIKHRFKDMFLLLLLLLLITLMDVLIIFIVLLLLNSLGVKLIVYTTLLLLIIRKLLINKSILFINFIPLVDKMMHGLKGMASRIGSFFTLNKILIAVISLFIGVLFKLFIMTNFHIDVFKDLTSLISIGFYMLMAFIVILLTVFIDLLIYWFIV